MQELIRCPYCGKEPIQIGATPSYMCCDTQCPIQGRHMPLSAWNKRYVTDDKNGKPVFVGNRAQSALGEVGTVIDANVVALQLDNGISLLVGPEIELIEDDND